MFPRLPNVRFAHRVLISAAMGLYTVALLLTGLANAAPPENQTYVGTKECAACHFEQYMTWKKSKHALSFETLPPEYKANEKCLKCHTTGFGAATGFKDPAATPNLTGISCEQCHGPGSEHVKVCKPLTDKKTLSDAEKAAAKGSTWRTLPKNVCTECHMAVLHKAHEPFEKKDQK
jgi:hypothetical protein